MRTSKPRSTWKSVGLFALVVALATTATLAGDGRLHVRIDEPFLFEGQRYPAGEVEVRPVDAFTPSMTLHEVRVNGRSVGMVMSRATQRLDRERTGDIVIFCRTVDGELVLVGHGYDDGSEQRYVPSRKAQRRATAAQRLAPDVSV